MLYDTSDLSSNIEDYFPKSEIFFKNKDEYQSYIYTLNVTNGDIEKTEQGGYKISLSFGLTLKDYSGVGSENDYQNIERWLTQRSNNDDCRNMDSYSLENFELPLDDNGAFLAQAFITKIVKEFNIESIDNSNIVLKRALLEELLKPYIFNKQLFDNLLKPHYATLHHVLFQLGIADTDLSKDALKKL